MKATKQIKTGFLLPFLALPLLAQQAITTRAGDDARSGWNSQETILTQDTIMKRGLIRQTTIPVEGDARGMEAEPLILPKVKLKDGSTHDVMILPSMANQVRGVDAQTGAGLWQVGLGMPITGSGAIDFHQINQHWGCLSTGVLVGSRWYGVCWVSSDATGSPQSGRYQMFVLNVADGSQVVPPIPVQGTDVSMWKQRSSLVFVQGSGAQGTIFFAHGSVYETGGGSNGYTGGITAFDVASNTVVAQLPMTAGIWMGGQGLVADPAGYLYGITGNGDFDPAQGWYGESFVKVKYTAPTGGSSLHRASLKVIDQWAPWTDYGRAGKPLPSEKLAGMSMPSEAMKPVGGNMSMSMKGARVVANMNEQGQPVALVYPMANGPWTDEDWGSAGPACIFALKICIATGKDGIAYPIRTKSLGGTTVTTVGTAANYAKLAAPCAWLTMAPGNVPCAPANPATLNFFPGGDTAHLHMTPVQMYDPLLKSWTIFAWGENAQLHKWSVSSTGKLQYVAQSHEYASADARGNPPGGMVGGECTGSGNASDPNSYLVVCSIPYGDANARVTNGRLLVYDPVHLEADGSLHVLWDSQQWGLAYLYNKFMTPIVWNGRIYLPNYNGGVDVYGLSN
jgi:hypothetical protein